MLFWKEERKESNFQGRCGGFLLTLPPQHPLGEGASHPPWSSPRNGLWFQFCVPRGNRGGSPALLLTQPWGVVGAQCPSQRGLCPKCHPGPDSPRDGQDRGCWMEETSRDKEQISPSKTCKGSFGDSSLCSPSLFSPPASAHPRDARLGTHPGDTARL